MTNAKEVNIKLGDIITKQVDQLSREIIETK